MKQKILRHTGFGAVLGLALWALFTLLAAYLRGTWQFPVVSYHLVRTYGSELGAVTAQCIGAVFCGILWCNAALIFRETDWNLLVQTLTHMAVCMVPALMIAYVLYFMPHSMDGLIQYLRLFGAVYVLNWAVQYLRLKKGVREINAQLNALREE